MPVQISFSDACHHVDDGETVLDCLIRNGVAVPHSCRSGVCQSCLMQSTEGDIPPEAQKGLKPTYVKQALFLACQCRPTENMHLQLPHAGGIDTPVHVIARDMLNHNVLRLRLEPTVQFLCEPGQYITLMNRGGIARSYSVANDPDADGHIELHIRLLANGLMSQYLLTDAQVGTAMTIRGPAGTCFYVPDTEQHYPIVLAGTGTGLAPLYGIVRHALAKGHKGRIQLFHGALQENDLYLVAELQALQAAHSTFRYVPCVLRGEPNQYYQCGNIEDLAMAASADDRAAVRLFLCGAPELVKSLRRKAFLAGVSSANIFADAFLPTRSAQSAA